MKYTSEVIQGIISTPEEFAFLEKILDNNCYYSITYKANPFLCARHNAFTVNIHISTKPFTSNAETVFNSNNASSNSSENLNAEEVLDKLLKRNTVIKQNINESRRDYLATIKSDITSFIPNDFAKNIKNNSVLDFIKKFKTFTNVKIAKIKSNGSSPLLISSFKTVGSSPYKNSFFTANELSSNLLLNKKIDPASLIKKYNLYDYAPTVYSGIQKPTNIDKTKFSNSIVSSFFEKNINQKQIVLNENNLSNESYIPIPTITSVNEVIGNVLIKLPIDLGSSSTFWIIYESVDNDGNVLERLIRSVDHTRMISSVSVPHIAPTINVVNKKSANSIQIKQNDDLAVGVKIYKRVISTTTANNSSNYSLIADLPLTKIDGFKNFKDINSGQNTCIYRAISYASNNVLSYNFSSIATSNNNSLASLNNKNLFCCLNYEVTYGGLKLKISHLPPDPIEIRVTRKDLSSKLNASVVNGKNYLLDLARNGNLEIIDKDVKNNRQYQYNVYFLYKDGSSSKSTTSLLVDNILPVEQVINTVIKNLKTISNGFFLDCSFDLESSFVEKQEQLLRNALEKAGALSYFGGDINKSKLQYALAYQIIRTNLSTGEIEDLGITTKTAFLDSAYSSVTSAKSLQKDCDYEYKILTYFRTPDSLLVNTLNQTKKRTTLDADGILIETLDFSFEPYKWRHPQNLKAGTLVSPASLKRNHSKSDFTFGEIGSISIGSISFKEELPVITTINCFLLNKKKIKVLWKITGLATKIDHFIVYNQSFFGKNIVGKTHNLTSNNSFEFIDNLTSGEIGSLTYSVVPVYFDYNLGKEVSANTIMI